MTKRVPFRARFVILSEAKDLMDLRRERVIAHGASQTRFVILSEAKDPIPWIVPSLSRDLMESRRNLVVLSGAID